MYRGTENLRKASYSPYEPILWGIRYRRCRRQGLTIKIHKLWDVLRCLKMRNNVKHVWSKGYSRTSRSPRSSGPFTQRHSRATSVALASVRSPLAWRCRRCHMDFHESKLDIARVLPHLLDLERCAKIAILCQRLEARENESKLESITQAQMSFAGPWDQTCLKQGPILLEGFKSFLYRACVRRKGLKQSLKRRTPKRYRQRPSSEHHDCHVASSSFCLAYLSMLGSAEW